MTSTIDTAQENALSPKTKLTGKIVKTTLVGAIVDIGLELPGVLHISQLQKESVNRVEDVVHKDQIVEVWVRRVKKDRIELTMIEPLELEWREIKPEMIVKGKVIRLESYGAFIEIGAERPGLIHVSEISHNYIKSPSEVVKEGDEVAVMILDVNRRKKQIRLSMKAILPKEVEEPLKIESKIRRKKEKNKPTNKENVVTRTIEPELTAMEIAWRSAMERAESNDDQKQKPTKPVASDEREDILKRTLKHRLPNG